jgi:hypothetical protein
MPSNMTAPDPPAKEPSEASRMRVKPLKSSMLSSDPENVLDRKIDPALSKPRVENDRLTGDPLGVPTPAPRDAYWNSTIAPSGDVKTRVPLPPLTLTNAYTGMETPPDTPAEVLNLQLLLFPALNIANTLSRGTVSHGARSDPFGAGSGIRGMVATGWIAAQAKKRARVYL